MTTRENILESRGNSKVRSAQKRHKMTKYKYKLFLVSLQESRYKETEAINIAIQWYINNFEQSKRYFEISRAEEPSQRASNSYTKK